MREKILIALKKHIPEDVRVDVSIAENKAFGHYSSNVSFKLAKIRSKAPREIAEGLARLLSNEKEFEKVEVAGGGFLNFRLSQKVLARELKDILKKTDAYGSKKLSKAKQKKIQVEYISANPTGPLTLANGRGGFLGDAISNVLAAAGHKVEREYYVNDTGNQVRTLGLSLIASAGFIPFEETFYKGEYVKDWALANKATVKKFKDEPEHLGGLAAKHFLKLIKTAIERKAGIHFDRYTSEKNDVHDKRFIEKALELFNALGVSYEKDGALWLKTTDYGDDKDRVLVTSEKTPTYFLADAGHYFETKVRGFDEKILILGPDHYGYVSRIQAAATIVGLPSSKVIITQAVRLIRGGKEAKMSKRKGLFVTFQELIEDVSPDAARFFFLMISPDTHMDFDLDLAKEKSLKNPVFYAQYAYVRAVSIIKKTKIKKGKENLSLLESGEDIHLMLKLSEFPEILEDAAEDYAIHRITKYILELSKAFHNFYEKERVGGVDDELVRARLALVGATAVVLKNALGVLGVSAPKKM